MKTNTPQIITPLPVVQCDPLAAKMIAHAARIGFTRADLPALAKMFRMIRRVKAGGAQ